MRVQYCICRIWDIPVESLDGGLSAVMIGDWVARGEGGGREVYYYFSRTGHCPGQNLENHGMHRN